MKQGALKATSRVKNAVFQEQIIKWLLFGCAFLSVATTVAIVWILVQESSVFFTEVSVWQFLLGTKWSPLLEPKAFGVLPLACGTLMIVIGSSVVALPLGLMSAIYLSEYASPKVRNIIKPVLEVLAGVPTVVYGYFALTFITPALRGLFPDVDIFNAASGAIVVGIMVLPMVCSLSDDALRAVPKALRQGAYAMGATSFEVTTKVTVPAGLSGIVAAFILAISRAIGETMAVTLAAGATPNMTVNPLESIQTMTAYMVQVSLGDTPAGSVVYQTIFAVAAMLFFITLAINILANRILKRYREQYE